MSDYFYIEIDIQDEDVLASLEKEAFEAFGCSGTQDFTIEEAKVDEILGDRSYSGGDLPVEVLEEVESVLKSEGAVKKVFYFNTKEEADSFMERLGQLELAESACLKQEQSKDWNESWKKSFKRIPVTDELEIIPSWEKSETTEKGIYIYPGMGFGTGNHETTFLCLKLMLEEISRNDLKTCLDFGCGSGILGIGFAEINPEASQIDYLDIDQQALDNCEQNIALNEKSQKIAHKLLLSDQKAELSEKYDLVFANILLEALLIEAETIVEKTGKYLIISGLLKGQEQEVISAYTRMNPKFECVKVAVKNDWSAALLRLN